MSDYLTRILHRARGEEESEMIQPQINIWHHSDPRGDIDWSSSNSFLYVDPVTEHNPQIPKASQDISRREIEIDRQNVNENIPEKRVNTNTELSRKITRPDQDKNSIDEKMRQAPESYPGIPFTPHQKKSKPDPESPRMKSTEAINDTAHNKSLSIRKLPSVIKESSFIEKIIERVKTTESESSQKTNHRIGEIPTTSKDKNEISNPVPDSSVGEERKIILPVPSQSQPIKPFKKSGKQEEIIIENLTVEVVRDTEPEPVTHPIQTTQKTHRPGNSSSETQYQRKNKLRFGLGQM